MFEKQRGVQIGSYCYYKEQILGRGATGTVYKGLMKTSQETIAVKVINLVEMRTKVKEHLLECEIDALTHIKAKYVVHTYPILKDKDHYYIPMEYCPNGTLQDYIKAKNCLPAEQALALFRRLLEGYKAIKENGFLHRDLKTENVLLSRTYDPVIVDFGFCERVTTENKKLPYNVGSPAYMSPEAYNHSCYSEKSDVWALGVILHEMLTGDIPHLTSRNIDKHFESLKQEKYARVSQSISHAFCRKVLLHSLRVNPNSRASCEDLLGLLRERPRISTNLSSPIIHVKPTLNFAHEKQGGNCLPPYLPSKHQGIAKLRHTIQYKPQTPNTHSLPVSHNNSLSSSIASNLSNTESCLSPHLGGKKIISSDEKSVFFQGTRKNQEFKKLFVNKTTTPLANLRTKILPHQPVLKTKQIQKLQMDSPYILHKFQLMSDRKKHQENSVEKIKKSISLAEVSTPFHPKR